MPRGATVVAKISTTGVAVHLSGDVLNTSARAGRKLPKAVSAVNGLNHNIAIGDAEVIIITGPTAAYSLCGFSRNGFTSTESDGRMLTVICLTQSLNVTIVDNDATDAATVTAIRTMRDANVTVNRFEGSVFQFMWSASQGQWIMISNSG